MNQTQHKHSDYALVNPLTADADISTEIENTEHEPIRHYWLYAIRLEGDKYYVGITTKKNPYERIYQHGGILGAAWTRKHRPLEVVEVRDVGFVTQAQVDNMEQKLTLAYMELYQQENVRGGFLTYTGRYIRRFNLFFTENDYYALTTVIFMMLVIALQTILYWAKN